jgi:hypothetical protein
VTSTGTGQPLSWYAQIDRRIVYVLVAVALGTPLFLPVGCPPAPLPAAKGIFDKVEEIAKEREAAKAKGRPWEKAVLVAVDWGPHTRAECYPQTEAVVRHLMARGIPFVILSTVVDGAGYSREIPDKLAREYGREYGKDWVDLGYKPGRSVLVRQLAKDFHGAAKTDRNGTPLDELEATRSIEDAGDISLLVEMTGLVGFFNMWVQFFQTDRARPDFAHGCTSVTIAEAYTYLESGQIIGLFEGIAGAAAYNELFEASRRTGQPHASPDARAHMTSQSFAHLLVIGLVVLGNVGVYVARRNSARTARRGGAS